MHTHGSVILDEHFKFLKIRKILKRWCVSDLVRVEEDDGDIRFSLQSIQWAPRDSEDELVQYLASTVMVIKDDTALGGIRVTPQFSGSVIYIRSKSAKYYNKASVSDRKYKFSVEVADIKELQGRSNTGEFSELIEGTEISITPRPDGKLPDLPSEVDREEFVRDMLDFCLQLWSDVKQVYSRAPC